MGEDSFCAIQSYLNFVDLAGSEKITNYFGATDGPKKHPADASVERNAK